jgi:DNA-binding NarL/FixJ family response regulator
MDAVRVFLVDDREVELRGLSRWLSTGSSAKLFEVVGAHPSGEAAVAAAETTVFDVAVVDFRMPGMSGIEVAEHLKALRPEAPVIILTAFEDARAEVEKSPAVDVFLEKIEIERLDETILRLTGRVEPQPTKRRWFRRDDHAATG